MRKPFPSRRQALVWASSSLVIPWVAGSAAAAESARDLRIVVPYPAGGAPDNSCRLMAVELARDLGVKVIVENRPGASGLLGARAVSQGPADGSMLVYASSGHVTLSAINPKFDLLRELRPVTRVSASPFVAVVSAQSGYKTMGDLLKAVQSQPGKLTYGTAGNGSPAHMAMEFLHEATGNFQVLRVPFKGAVESINAILGGQIDFTIGVLGAALPLIKAGKLRALGVTTSERQPVLPEVPTIAEGTGTKYRYASWGALMMHPKTPDEVVARLDASIRKFAQSKVFEDFLASSGGQRWISASPAELEAQLRRDLEVETQIVTRLKLRQE